MQDFRASGFTTPGAALHRDTHHKVNPYTNAASQRMMATPKMMSQMPGPSRTQYGLGQIQLPFQSQTSAFEKMQIKSSLETGGNKYLNMTQGRTQPIQMKMNQQSQSRQPSSFLPSRFIQPQAAAQRASKAVIMSASSTDTETDSKLDDKYLYRIWYFPGYVRGEPMRMLLNHAKVPFDDHIITFDKWPDVKPTMPNKQIPMVERADGTKMAQSHSIMRYFGKLYGYYPEDPREAQLCDQLIDEYEPVLKASYYPHFFISNPEKMESMLPDIFDNLIPNFLTRLDPLLEKGQWLLGDKLTIADFWIGGLYTNLINNPNKTFAHDKFAKVLEDFPNFKAYGERFEKANEAHMKERGQYPV